MTDAVVTDPVRARLVSAAAFALAAAAFAVTLLALLGGTGGDGGLWVGAPLSFALSGALVGAVLAPRLSQSVSGGEASAIGVVATTMAALAYGLGVAITTALADIVRGDLPFRGDSLEDVVFIFVILLLGSIPGMPFGAIAGWGAWRWWRRTP